MKCIAFFLVPTFLLEVAFAQDWTRRLLPSDGSAPAPEIVDTLVNSINRAINSEIPNLRFQNALTGKECALASFRGKVVLIATWHKECAPCLGELPDLKMLQSKLKNRGFVLVTLSPDDAETQKMVLSARDAMHDGIVAQSPLDRYEYPLQWFISPSHYLIDREGRLREFWHGGTTFDTFFAKVRKYL